MFYLIQNAMGMLESLSQWQKGLTTNREALRLWVNQRLLPWEKWWRAVELSLIVAWALWIAREYLNFNSGVWPDGGEFPMVIQSHYIWDLLAECGTCVFWNGFQNGGAPAFVELHGAPLNPIVILTTLAFGVINGSKLTLVISLVMAGWAQWWMARISKLGAVARLWSALLVVTAGHLAGKMENGGLTLILSTALASLVIAAGLSLALNGRRKTAIGLGILLALTFTAGQGYLQIGLLVAIFPAFLIVMFDDDWKLKPVWKDFLLAGVIGVLLTGIFLVPFLNFWPNFNKAMDPQFASAQAIQYIPLTWIIENVTIFRESVITPQPHAYLYINYIGWIPILFSLVAIRLVPRAKLRLLAFFLVALLLVLIASSGFIFANLMDLLPQVIAGIRNTPLIAGLSVPLILAIAAWGLDCLLKLDWPTLSLKSQSGKGLRLKATWLVLAIPLFWSLQSAYRFSQDWLRAYPPPLEVAQITGMMNPDATQWIAPPYGELYWLPGLLGQGYKLTNVVRPWNWKGNTNPPGHLVALRDYSGVLDESFVGESRGVSLFQPPGVEYAAVQTVNGLQPCQAEARGGHIDVICETDIFGDLIVQEHWTQDWIVTIDGEPAKLRPTQWLNVLAPEGKHVYEFRYRPWDVPLGALVSLLGVFLVIWFWYKAR